jgi:Spy/CpxP family protein refolding chaperone
MKKQLTILSLAVATLCYAPATIRALDAVPPKPPGGDTAPPAAGDKPGNKPEGKGERRPGGGEGRMDPAERLKMMTEKLGLTPDQQEKIKAIQEKNAPKFKEFMAKGRENLTEEDKTKFRELMKSQMEEIGAILTPEQKEKMKELRPGGPGGDRKPGERRGKPGDAK